jgi:hypothetical protein
VLTVIPPVVKVMALVISIGMFYWESGATDSGYLTANIAILVINAGWIISDAKGALLFGVVWETAWILFVMLQWKLLSVKYPGLYLAVALSSRAVAMHVKKTLI